jgi:hypothetical protein
MGLTKQANWLNPARFLTRKRYNGYGHRRAVLRAEPGWA